MSKRPVIVHFHLFKNAGTSVDTILKQNFPKAWAEIEGPKGKRLDTQDLLTFIRQNPHLKAVSSHTAVVNVPDTPDIKIIPIFFMRHPIDRIRSGYDFERKQDAQTPGAIKAKEADFHTYLSWRLSTPAPWAMKNFHMIRLKNFFGFIPDKNNVRSFWRAYRALRALPVVGLVEAFDPSMERYASLIRPYFPDFQTFEVLENVTAENAGSSSSDKLTENLLAFKSRIGDATYAKLVRLNRFDLMLYGRIKRRFKSVL